MSPVPTIAKAAAAGLGFAVLVLFLSWLSARACISAGVSPQELDGEDDGPEEGAEDDHLRSERPGRAMQPKTTGEHQPCNRKTSQ